MANKDKTWLNIELLWCAVLLLALFVANLVYVHNSWFFSKESAHLMEPDNEVLLCVDPRTNEYTAIGTREDLLDK